MKRILISLVFGVVIGVVLATWIPRHRSAPGAAAEKTEGAKKEHEGHEAGEVEEKKAPDGKLHLSKEEQAGVGLTVIQLQAVERVPERKAYGRVLDASSLAAQLTDVQAARAAAKASTREFERLKILKEHGDNASARALETGEATAQRDTAVLEAAEARLVSAWGQSLSRRDGLSELSREILNQRAGIIRVDLLAGETLERTPGHFRARPLLNEESILEAEWLSVAPAVDAQAQGASFLGLIRTNPPPPGTALVVSIPSGAPARPGVLLPRPAVVRHQGEVFIYVQTGEEIFERRRVELGSAETGGYVVETGLGPQEKVVTIGAQQLLSAELKAGGGEE